MVSHEERKLERLRHLENAIKKVNESGKELDQEKLINQCIMKWGSSRRTILEYLKVVRS